MPNCHSYKLVTEYCDEITISDRCLFFAKNRLKVLYGLEVVYEPENKICPIPCNGYWFYLETRTGEIFKLHSDSPLAMNVILLWNHRYSNGLENWIHKIRKVTPVNQLPEINCDNDKYLRTC